MNRSQKLIRLIEAKTVKVDGYYFAINLAEKIGVAPDKLPMDLYTISGRLYPVKNKKELKALVLKELKSLSHKYDFAGLIIPVEGEYRPSTGHGLPGSEMIGGIAAFGRKEVKREKPIKVTKKDLL